MPLPTRNFFSFLSLEVRVLVPSPALLSSDEHTVDKISKKSTYPGGPI